MKLLPALVVTKVIGIELNSPVKEMASVELWVGLTRKVILSPTFKEFRNVMYDYHIKGLDILVSETKAGKQAVAKSLMLLDNLTQLHLLL